MITSSLPGEGKSFISFQLWKMLAELNASVLLIDCDLRKSVMKEKLGLRSDDLTTGIEHYLSAQANLEDVIYETNIPNGYVIPCFSSVVNPTVLLESDYFRKMIEETGRKFDYIILDTAPVISVADALKISQYADGTVLVVRSNDTPRKFISETVQLLKRASKPLLGIVLNRIDTTPKGSGYYKYYYHSDYYKSYYGKDGK